MSPFRLPKLPSMALFLSPPSTGFITSLWVLPSLSFTGAFIIAVP